MSKHAWWIALAILSVTPSCIHRASHGTPVGAVSHSAPPQPIAFEVVPAGTTFRIVLAQPLQTAYVLPGQPFVAFVLDKLTSREGRVIVPASARVVGRIASVDLGSIESVRISFDTIETVRGTAELRATVYGVERFRGGVAFGARNPESSGYDAIVVAPQQPSAAAIGGGPMGDEPIPHRAVVALPVGAQITLALRRPLVMP